MSQKNMSNTTPEERAEHARIAQEIIDHLAAAEALSRITDNPMISAATQALNEIGEMMVLVKSILTAAPDVGVPLLGKLLANLARSRPPRQGKPQVPPDFLKPDGL